MRDLIRRALDRWRRASRADAPSAERLEALCTIPELCSALETVGRSAGGDGAPAAAPSGSERERFARHVAHEVRNRVNMVEMSLLRLEKAPDPAEVRARLDPVRKALRNLCAAVEDLGGLDDASRHPVFDGNGVAPFDETIRNLVAACADLAEERGVVLEVAEDLPSVPVHAARLELTLANLLANALDHADPEKPVRRVRVEVSAVDGETPGWRVGVVDNGLGIPRHLQGRVFDERVRGEAGAEDGRGLGLTVAREAVERQGGRIWIESEVGAGTSVYFTVPKSGD